MTPDELKQITARIESNDPSLQELTLERCNLTDTEGKALAKALEHNTCIRTLKLSNNRLTKLTAQAFAHLLQGNKTLQFLDLGGNPLGLEGGEALAPALKSNTTLHSLLLWGCQLEAGGCFAIAQSLRKNTSLQLLNLGGNFSHLALQLSYWDGNIFVDALKNNVTLCQLEGITLTVDLNKILARNQDFQKKLKGVLNFFNTNQTIDNTSYTAAFSLLQTISQELFPPIQGEGESADEAQWQMIVQGNPYLAACNLLLRSMIASSLSVELVDDLMQISHPQLQPTAALVLAKHLFFSITPLEDASLDALVAYHRIILFSLRNTLEQKNSLWEPVTRSAAFFLKNKTIKGGLEESPPRLISRQQLLALAWQVKAELETTKQDPDDLAKIMLLIEKSSESSFLVANLLVVPHFVAILKKHVPYHASIAVLEEFLLSDAPQYYSISQKDVVDNQNAIKEKLALFNPAQQWMTLKAEKKMVGFIFDPQFTNSIRFFSPLKLEDDEPEVPLNENLSLKTE